MIKEELIKTFQKLEPGEFISLWGSIVGSDSFPEADTVFFERQEEPNVYDSIYFFDDSWLGWIGKVGVEFKEDHILFTLLEEDNKEHKLKYEDIWGFKFKKEIKGGYTC